MLSVFPIAFPFGQQTGLSLRPTLPVAEVLMVGGIVLAVAIVAALQPAWKAASVDPIRALRHI